MSDLRDDLLKAYLRDLAIAAAALAALLWLLVGCGSEPLIGCGRVIEQSCVDRACRARLTNGLRVDVRGPVLNGDLVCCYDVLARTRCRLAGEVTP